MSISAAQVKALRERTGAGMMECKKALVEADGDLEQAVEVLRKSGQAKADKKAGRVAAEGRIVVLDEAGAAVIAEINCETDFVANDDNFTGFADLVTRSVLAHRPADVAALMALEVDGMTLEQRRTDLIAKIGENIGVRRFTVVEAVGRLASYVHGSRIGVLIDVEGGDETLARDLAMHVAATNPACVSADQVDPEMLAKERDILLEQARQEGKPEEIVQKMVEGRVRKYLSEITLVGQPFVKDPDVKVEKLLKTAGATVKGFVRFEVGEGIEKKQDNFVEEVMAQVRGG
ncbi:MAG: elongation factor Ts [Gammaproteobacteria bacterium]|nr:elongation factor Ts [Gammaproteobacteria bacterium]TVQ43558.1 MAG: elongation factor Ts [Gammaproteobacteria bacterium]